MTELRPITYKPIFNSKGDFQHIELWQGDQHISISFVPQSPHHAGYKWDEVVEIMENLAQTIRERVEGQQKND